MKPASEFPEIEFKVTFNADGTYSMKTASGVTSGNYKTNESLIVAGGYAFVPSGKYLVTAYDGMSLYLQQGASSSTGSESKPEDTTKPEETDKTPVTGTTKTVTHPKGSYVNFRSNATDYNDANVIAQLATGTKVEVLGVSGGFTKVSYNGTVGYINSNYLK